MPKKVAKNPVADLLRKLPSVPGIYQFFDSTGRMIYIGKAKVLKNRVKSYFSKSSTQSPKTERLIKEIADLKWLETSTEVEALALEANLVKEHQPRFNVLLRDDKHFLYLKITTQEDFPQIMTVRRLTKDGAKYFGPKTDARATRDAVKLVQKLFKIRTCSLGLVEQSGNVKVTKKTIKYPCLYAHLGQCGAPCDSQITKADYAELVSQAVAFLGGDTHPILKTLRTKMQTAAEQKNFELAAQLRDKVQSLENIGEKQVVSNPDLASRDVIGLAVDTTRAYLAVLEVREGKLINQQNFELKTAESAPAEILEAFIQQYYNLVTDLPREILLSEEIEDSENLAKWLSKKADRKVKILTPQKGKKESLLRLAEKNAAAFRVQSKAKFENASERTVGAVKELADALGIERTLKRIEAYDISHLGGTATVGSMVVLEHGEPKNADYRQFKIRTLPKGKVDDYASLSEVLGRRMSYLVAQNPEIKIRKATKKNLVVIKKLLVQYPRLDQTFDSSRDEWFVALRKKDLVGFYRFIKYDQVHVEHASLVVLPEYREQGLGKLLIRHALEKCPAKKLYVLTGSLVSLYEQLGFQLVRQPPTVLQAKLKRCDSNPIRDGDPMYTLVYEKKSQKTDSSFAARPDLVILDGGKGQLSSVLKVVKFPKTTTVVGLAKREEEIFRIKDLKAKKLEFEKVLLPKNSNALHLIQRIRDEAHRTANDLRKKVLNKIDKASALDELSGLGADTRKLLLQKFGSMTKLKTVSMVELTALVGFQKAGQIHKQLN